MEEYFRCSSLLVNVFVMTQERGDGAHCVNKESFSAVPTDASKGRRRDREPLCSFLSLVCFPPPICRLYACHAVNMCKCLLAVVWQLIFYGFASVRRAPNIHWLMKPNYPRLLPFHRGSQSQRFYVSRTTTSPRIRHTQPHYLYLCTHLASHLMLWLPVL